MQKVQWLERGELFQTPDEEIKCDIEQVRETLKEDNNSQKNQGFGSNKAEDESPKEDNETSDDPLDANDDR